MTRRIDIKEYHGPVGGWGSAKSVIKHTSLHGPVRVAPKLLHQNKPGGFMCVSCAWAKPSTPHLFEFCENGAKATAWELDPNTVGPEFFAKHTLSSLRRWPDHDLEMAGRLSHPLRYDKTCDKYIPVSWEEAFAEIGRELRPVAPEEAVFYASGRASLETSYLYALFARMFGSNNLPDSSNMCHETTSVALPESIGVPVGTVHLDDFDKTDCIMFFGQNVGTNSPRMLHPLQQASKRGVPIITFNPLVERGLERFTNPQSPKEMLTNEQTRLSTQYHQVFAGGDIAAIMGVCKAVFDLDDKALAAGAERVLDVEFIQEHTHGFDAFAALVRRTTWEDIEHASGLKRLALEECAGVYAKAEGVMAMYGMGLTQHVKGVESVQMVINLLLLRGNIGKLGAGICPIRGHSNVQGQRTVGIAEKPELVPLDKLAEQYDFVPPRWEGMTTVDVCECILQGKVKSFIGLGGNFLRAIPDTERMEKAWSGLRLSVQIATKLNRTHLIPGEVSFLLPCLGRIEIDEQATGAQVVTMEDSTAMIHASHGKARPVSEHLLSETRIVAELAMATLPPNPKVDWRAFVADYGLIREAIEKTYPEDFRDFNARMDHPGGFPRPIAARDRKWQTESGKANFICPVGLSSHGFQATNDVLRLMTLRSNDQFNTTIYGYLDRLRGIHGTRMVVLINLQDMERLQLQEADVVTLASAAGDGVVREVSGLRVTPYNIPQGCIAAYYPECNPLIPLSHYAERSKVPAAKSVPVTLRKTEPNARPDPQHPNAGKVHGPGKADA